VDFFWKLVLFDVIDVTSHVRFDEFVTLPYTPQQIPDDLNKRLKPLLFSIHGKVLSKWYFILQINNVILII